VKYIVRPCIEDFESDKNGKPRSFISIADSDDEAHFFGAYKVKEDGTESWLADFKDRIDAEMFALEKEGETT
jgi:hypothetical protein